MSSLIDIPSAQENSKAFQQVIPQEDRDFSRPKEPFWPENMPKDIDFNLADTNITLPDVEIKTPKYIELIQKFLRSNPLGPNYLGPIDNKINPELTNLLNLFQSAASAKFNKSFKVMSGSSINYQEIMKIIRLLKGLPDPDEEKKDVPIEFKGSDLIKAYQNFFASGGIYSGPKDGIVNKDLIAAAKKTEQYIASKINNKSVIGMIWSDSGQTFLTSPQEIKEVLSLLIIK